MLMRKLRHRGIHAPPEVTQLVEPALETRDWNSRIYALLTKWE